ncbi:MAG: hypothetical protein K2Q33_07240, partial [Gammaproteobacteria bacterium]|nr:hypothetical protein [Gammaproteobacteria bacterium]
MANDTIKLYFGDAYHEGANLGDGEEMSLGNTTLVNLKTSIQQYKNKKVAEGNDEKLAITVMCDSFDDYFALKWTDEEAGHCLNITPTKTLNTESNLVIGSMMTQLIEMLRSPDFLYNNNSGMSTEPLSIPNQYQVYVKQPDDKVAFNMGEVKRTSYNDYADDNNDNLNVSNHNNEANNTEVDYSFYTNSHIYPDGILLGNNNIANKHNDNSVDSITLFLESDCYQQAIEKNDRGNNFISAIKTYSNNVGNGSDESFLSYFSVYFNVKYNDSPFAVGLRSIEISPNNMLLTFPIENQKEAVLAVVNMLQSDEFEYATKKDLSFTGKCNAFVNPHGSNSQDDNKNGLKDTSYNRKPPSSVTNDPLTKTAHPNPADDYKYPLLSNPLTRLIDRNPVKALAANVVTSAAVGGAVGAGLFAAYLSLSAKVMGAGILAGTIVAGPLGGLVAAIVIGAIVGGGAALLFGAAFGAGLRAHSMFSECKNNKQPSTSEQIYD